MAAGTYRARLKSRTGSPVQRITLELPAGFNFSPGQYLEVVHPAGAIPLSIASAPWRLPTLHLHYRSMPDAPDAARFDELLERGGPLTVRGPAGDVSLPLPPTEPVLFVAGGTGIAQVLSFLDAFSRAAPSAPVTLAWCADDAADFYLRDELEALDAPWLRCVFLADADRTPANRAMTWLRDNAAGFAAGGRAPAEAPRIILAGGPGFVRAARAELLTAGVDEAQLQSDMFSFL